jgi:hypothetical protein
LSIFDLKKRDTVVGIGAHIGHHTLIVDSSKQVGANGKAVAIKAYPSNFEMLRDYIMINKIVFIAKE